MIQMHDGKILKAKNQMVLREEFDDWAILYNPDTGRAVGLSPTAITIWRHLASENRDTLETVARSIEEEYTDIPEDLLKSIREFVDSTIQHGYTEESSERP
jgi:hypothetical protein